MTLSQALKFIKIPIAIKGGKQQITQINLGRVDKVLTQDN